VEFLKYVEDRNYCRALNIARVDLGPLAAKFPDLLQPLKETLLALAHPKGEPSLKLTPAGVQAAALHVVFLPTTPVTHKCFLLLESCPLIKMLVLGIYVKAQTFSFDFLSQGSHLYLPRCLYKRMFSIQVSFKIRAESAMHLSYYQVMKHLICHSLPWYLCMLRTLNSKPKSGKQVLRFSSLWHFYRWH